MSAEAINSKQEAIEGVVNKRLKNLVEFLEEMGEGSVKQAKALWVMKRVHLSEHPVNYYFRLVTDGGVIDVDGPDHFRFKHNPFSGVRAETENKARLDLNSDTPFTDLVNKEQERDKIIKRNLEKLGYK